MHNKKISIEYNKQQYLIGFLQIVFKQEKEHRVHMGKRFREANVDCQYRYTCDCLHGWQWRHNLIIGGCTLDNCPYGRI